LGGRATLSKMTEQISSRASKLLKKWVFDKTLVTCF
jgi:hypothetical protein